MYRSHHLSTLAATASAAFFLSAAVLLSSEPARSDPADQRQPAPPAANDGSTLRPTISAIPMRLNPADELATLEAIHLTLSEVGDGSTFVWRRANGRISGVFQPTQSFRDDAGRICRHFRMMLSSGTYSRKTEAIACRGIKGAWTLDG